MAELTTTKRNRLKDSEFAYVDRSGDRHLPINDEEHVRNAIARFSQTDFDTAAEKRSAALAIMDAAQRHGIEVDPSDDVAWAARRRS